MIKRKNINIDDIENYELNTDYYRAIIIHKFIDTRDKGVGLYKKDIHPKEMFIERLSRLKKYIDDNKKELELLINQKILKNNYYINSDNNRLKQIQGELSNYKHQRLKNYKIEYDNIVEFIKVNKKD